MVLVSAFCGLRPIEWQALAHLQPRSGGFAAALPAAAEAFASMLATGQLRRDEVPRGTALWIDDGEHGSHRTAGLVLELAVDARGGDAVLPHERTFPEPVARRVQTRRLLGVDTNPGLVLLRDQVDALTELLSEATRQPSLGHDDGGTRHHATAVAVPDDLVVALRGVPALIADGHHRIAAALAPGARDRGRAMAWLVAADQPPRLHAVHRTLRRLPPDAMARLARAGILLEPAPPMPTDRPVLVTGEGAFALTPAPTGAAGRRIADEPAALRDLHVTFVQHLLVDVLGIGSRREAMGTTIDSGAAVAAVAKGTIDAAVLACGPNLDEVWRAAEAGVRMPPKATWFAPKPRSGAVLRPLPPTSEETEA